MFSPLCPTSSSHFDRGLSDSGSFYPPISLALSDHDIPTFAGSLRHVCKTMFLPPMLDSCPSTTSFVASRFGVHSHLWMGSILLTNDGNAILHEIDVAHPAAKNMVELSRMQGEECSNGTTSVIIIPAGEILAQSLTQIERDIHPVVISAYNKALKESLEILSKISVPINTSSDEGMLSPIKTSIGTKFVARWSDLMCCLALQAVRTVATEENGQKTIDIEESIQCPRIIFLDCPLEYKKGKSQTNMEFSKQSDWARSQEIEEEQVIAQCKHILKFRPDLVITEKGISDTAQHVFERANISAI
ncbi:TCP-1/cpn60 chaperonin family-domain-containing protein [Boletus reticuloceps]|uniref:TCP-1/cpn60 chaperonin family-domain-containing protein n=1 Tax=Boletus reticuloceps TaxID=495285 RepID=A0A8I2YLW2_9AGAM|nr:TCP-1/cpn60 chaperonin family-domain-containing protein [Boletus reticuloceps]